MGDGLITCLFVWSKDELALRLERGWERFRALHSKCVLGVVWR